MMIKIDEVDMKQVLHLLFNHLLKIELKSMKRLHAIPFINHTYLFIKVFWLKSYKN